MEYREIRYTVRTRIERNEWTVSIHPADVEGARIVVTGPRVRAGAASSIYDRPGGHGTHGAKRSERR